MKPSQVFGIIVRVIGVLSLLAGIWRGGRLIYLLTHQTVFDGRMTIPLTSGDIIFFENSVPTVVLIAIGFALIRPNWLIRFCYADDSKS